MIKKIGFVVCTLMVCAATVTAQTPGKRRGFRTPTAIGVIVSGQHNYSRLDGGHYLTNEVSLTPLSVLFPGFLLKRDLSPHSSMLTGIQFGANWGLSYGGKVMTYYASIHVPLMARYYLNGADAKRRLFIEGGPVLRFAQMNHEYIRFSGTIGRGSSGGPPGTNYYWDVKWVSEFRNINNPTWGANLGVGIEQRLGKRWNIGLSASYHHGFQNLVDNNISVWRSEQPPPPGALNPDPESYVFIKEGTLDVKGNAFGFNVYTFFYPFKQ